MREWRPPGSRSRPRGGGPFSCALLASCKTSAHAPPAARCPSAAREQLADKSAPDRARVVPDTVAVHLGDSADTAVRQPHGGHHIAIVIERNRGQRVLHGVR